MDGRLQELLAINRAIAGTLDYEALLALIVDKTAQLTGADACALLLAGEGGTAHLAAWRGLPDERARAFAARFDERIESALAELLGHRAEDAFLGVPVIRRGRVSGMLVVHHRGAAAAVDGQEELLTALADQAAISLDHAGRYRALWRESQRARRELELAADRKDEFLAMLSHELRNPLAAIVNAVGVLERRLSNDPQLARVQKIAARQAMHMKRLLDDLLDVSRVSRGKIDLDRRRVPVQRIVRQAVESTQHLYAERSDPLTVDVPEEPLVVHGDPDRLAQVIANLLTNSAKYSQPSDPVRLTVAQRTAADGGSGEVELRVADGGEGIPADLLATVFDLFVQSDRGKDRRQGGLGIGLTLVRRLIELHGGSVEAHSDGAGQGSEFVVRLPLASVEEVAVEEVAAEEVAAAETPTAETSGEETSGAETGAAQIRAVEAIGSALAPAAGTGNGPGPGGGPGGGRDRDPGQADGDGRSGDGGPSMRRVLVVEDNGDVATALAALLESQGHRVQVAEDGETALERVVAELPDVMLVDIGLPGMDGYEVARRLRRQYDGASPVLVALTGYGSESDRTRAREAGFHHHLVKPVRPADLVRILGVRGGAGMLSAATISGTPGRPSNSEESAA